MFRALDSKIAREDYENRPSRFQQEDQSWRRRNTEEVKYASRQANYVHDILLLHNQQVFTSTR